MIVVYYMCMKVLEMRCTIKKQEISNFTMCFNRTLVHVFRINKYQGHQLR